MIWSGEGSRVEFRQSIPRKFVFSGDLVAVYSAAVSELQHQPSSNPVCTDATSPSRASVSGRDSKPA